jgi:competence protein ComEC
LKKLFLIIYASLFVGYVTANIIPANDSLKSILLEAESGKIKEFQIISDSTASCGKYVEVKDSGSVAWNVNVPRDGYYQICFCYRAHGGEKVEFLVKNDIKIALGFGIAEEWNLLKKDIHLLAGNNSIGIQSSWGNLDLDYIRINETTVEPTLKPKKNIFYKEFPDDLSYKINLNNSRLEKITCGQKKIIYASKIYPHQEDAAIVTIPKEELAKLKSGNRTLKFILSDGKTLLSSLKIMKDRKPAAFTIIAPDIEHGASVIIVLPSKKVLLIDCAKDWARDSILIPLLHRNGIEKIDYFMLTHYHEDHDSGDKGEKIKKQFGVDKFWDYQSFNTGDEFELDDTHIKILNSYEDGDEENTRSLSIKIEYKGFVYVHGGDTYGLNQQKIMKRFPNDIEADVFHANHHFHGSVDIDYLRALNPSIVLVQAQEAIYARSAYMESFKKNTEKYLIKNKKRFVEDLPALEVGNIIIRVNSKNDWTYETRRNVSAKIPFLF